jgi:hypothetical protein
MFGPGAGLSNGEQGRELVIAHPRTDLDGLSVNLRNDRIGPAEHQKRQRRESRRDRP